MSNRLRHNFMRRRILLCLAENKDYVVAFKCTFMILHSIF